MSESTDANIEVERPIARPGDRVSLSVTPKDGIEITEIMILDASGGRISLASDGSFRMPNGNVNIAVKTARKVYTVTFVASGKTVAVFNVLHGERIEPPKPPKLESDNLYSYDFVRWYPSNDVITRNVPYTAMYSRTLLPIKEVENDIGITPSVMRYVVLSAVAVSLFVIGVLPVAITVAVYVRREQRRSTPEEFYKKR